MNEWMEHHLISALFIDKGKLQQLAHECNSRQKGQADKNKPSVVIQQPFFHHRLSFLNIEQWLNLLIRNTNPIIDTHNLSNFSRPVCQG